ncbi:UNVERIFIED_CONTAM: hypothetical protein K2H54_038584 [Gekko kuhli]
MQQPPAPAAALLLVLLATASSQTLFHRTREEASQFLRQRHRRAFQVFEEAKQGHLERECVEEICNKEEAREVFENDPETRCCWSGNNRNEDASCSHSWGSCLEEEPLDK